MRCADLSSCYDTDLRTLRSTTAFGADFFAEVLRKTYPFSSWRWPDLMRLGRIAEYRKYKPTEFVAQQGSLANELFVVIQGSVKLSQDVLLDSSGSIADEQDAPAAAEGENTADISEGVTVRVDIAVISTHEVVGESDMLERRSRRVNIVALSSLEVLVLRRSGLLNLIPKSTLHELETLGSSREELHLRRVETALMRVSSAEMRRIKRSKLIERRREVRRMQLERKKHNAPVKQGWYSITGRKMQTILAPLEKRLEQKQLDGRQATAPDMIIESGQRARRMLRRLYSRQSASLLNDAGGSALPLHVASNLSKMLRFDRSSYVRYLRVSPSVHFDNINELQTPRRPSLRHSQTLTLLPEIERRTKATATSHHSTVDKGSGHHQQQQQQQQPRALLTSQSVPNLSHMRPSPYGYSRLQHRFGERDKNTDHLTWLTRKYLKPGRQRPAPPAIESHKRSQTNLIQ